MSAQFDLVIAADQASRSAEFTLRSSTGAQLAYHRTDFTTISLSHRQGLFDLHNYLQLYVADGGEHAAVSEIGVCIAREVLGADIADRLWASTSQRTLRIQLPGATEVENHLAAALARVPWEMAKPSAEAETLGERNLLVRVVHEMAPPASAPLALAPDEPLRLLFVFAEARGSRPLGARKERRALMRLFEQEVYPTRRVVAHYLTHGVTRERLHAQIQENDGYHAVHWSGHGNLNRLELCKAGGASDHLSGQDLLDLFNDAGGFLPRLFFLSACQSGDMLRVKNWNDFLAVAQGDDMPALAPGADPIEPGRKPGYTGTAHALLEGGVPAVVAMRYAVGDDYARDIGIEFYRALLAHAKPKSVAAALTMARLAMRSGERHGSSRFAICDHATPLLYGEDLPAFVMAKGRSPDLNPRDPRLQQITELTTAGHAHFVGRTWELVALGADFIGSSTGSEVKPVAVITGLGGMGKTALTAEALALWAGRFEWVLQFQAKPAALGFEATLREIHMRLMGELKQYHDHVSANRADAIYRDASAEFTGPERLARLARNLLRAMRDEPILLVLDNFEGNLKPVADPAAPAGQPAWACQDPAWDELLALLADGLIGSPSRVLITCRRPLQALAGRPAHAATLGPLPPSEAALYLREHPQLSHMIFDADAASGDRELAFRLLNASRFHPLLMDRLARLAGEAAQRPQLLTALDALEKSKDLAQLPALFSELPGNKRELAYLDDALTTSLDQLIGACAVDARRLLWMIALSNQPEPFGLVQAVWADCADRPETLPTLLNHLSRVGLVTQAFDGAQDKNPALSCHELVRERILAWMAQHPADLGVIDEARVRRHYATHLEAVYDDLRLRNMTAALGAGTRALVYFVQANAWEQLDGFASGFVTSVRDPQLLEALLPYLQTAAESAPEGEPRWNCLLCLADALRLGGRADASFPLFEQAAEQARAVAQAGADQAATRSAWSGLAAIVGNWANALMDVGDFDAARQRLIESAEAKRKVGRPEVDVIASELEALRIDIMRGHVATARPEVASRVARVEAWWQQYLDGHPSPETPDPDRLARAIISALDVANDADRADGDFGSALRRSDAILAAKQAIGRPITDLARTRLNRAIELVVLDHDSEAMTELEDCLEIFKNDPAMSATVLDSLARLFDKQNDVAEAIKQQRRALARRDQVPDPVSRAVSHSNLANYLRRVGTPAARLEAAQHQFAHLVYCVAAGLGQQMQTAAQNYVYVFYRERIEGDAVPVPTVAKLIAAPGFAPLDLWLRQRRTALDALQQAIDDCLAEARQAALAVQ